MKVSFTNPIISPSVSRSNYVNNRNINATNCIENRSVSPAHVPVSISFTGNPSKHTNQIASIASEYQGPLNSILKAGGLGNVAGEAAVAFHDKGNADIRTFVPYYAPDNENGGIKIKTPLLDEKGKRVKWQVSQQDGSSKSVDAYTFKSVPVNYKLKDDEAFVMHDFVLKDKPWATTYVELEDTNIKGSVTTIKEDFSGMEKTPYHMFQIKGTGSDVEGNPPVYIMHTPGTAKFSKAYMDSVSKDSPDLSYAKTYRAVIDALPKMDTKKFGNFNPASFWLHDRQVFSVLPLMAEKSENGDEYWNGLRVHNSFHNPGRDYQGYNNNPFEFMRIVGTEADLKAIKSHPDYKFVKECEKKINKLPVDGYHAHRDITKVLNEKEVERLQAVFDPIIGNFKDEYGDYNACKIPVEGVRKNPYNISAGTVSTNYGKEMKNHNSKEIALGLTSDFASIPTIDIVNGSTPASLNLDKIGNFGKGNGFEPLMADNFHPLTKEVMADPRLLAQAKDANKKFVISTVAAATKEGPDALAKLFFNEKQLADGCCVLGGLSDFDTKDVLFIGWGRPTDQKGFPTSIESVKQYFMSDAPEEEKMHAKFLFGAGPWSADDENYQAIQKGMKEIAELDGGKYKGQVAYVNGFFSNRMVACTDYALITSVYEPCGITPLEAFSAGTPVISNATGGSPDFIFPYNIEDGDVDEKMNGLLTKHAFLINPEVMGLDKDVSREELTQARRKFLGKENADCIATAMELKKYGYHKMMKNCLKLSIDWHNNNDFNGGRSAMERYFNDAWHIGSDLKEIPGLERNVDPLKALKGKMAVATYSNAA